MFKNSLKMAVLAGGVLVPGIAAAAASAVVTTDLNFRTGPSTGYPAFDVIPAGDDVTVYGCLTGYVWCDIDWAGYRGWVSGDYLAYLGERYYRRPISTIGISIGLPVVVYNRNTYYDRWYADDYFDRWVRREVRQDRREDRREFRQERREDRREVRRDRREDRRDARQERREDRQEARPDRRDRQAERQRERAERQQQQERQQQRAARQERQQEQAARQQRNERADRQQMREQRRAARQEARQERREDRQETRQSPAREMLRRNAEQLQGR